MRIIYYLRNTLICCLVVLLIYPLSPYIFNKIVALKEPNFIMPLYGQRQLHIREDEMGDGYFDASRSGGKRRHKGLDIEGDIGEPVVAAKSGIASTGEVVRGMGKYVKITHPDGSMTIYGHLSSVDVENKSWVWQGEIIGKIGKTGNANYPNMKPHLHFEIKIDGEAIDPQPLLSKK